MATGSSEKTVAVAMSALTQADTTSVFQVDRRNQQHAEGAGANVDVTAAKRRSA